jgi:hypothetical protein
MAYRKTLNWPKISLLALNTASLELDSGLPVKSRKIDQKINFFRKFLKSKKILTFKMTRKKFSTRKLKKIDTHF